MSTAKKITIRSDQAFGLDKPEECRRILVVDDEAGILQAYKDILAPENKSAVIKSSRVKNIESKKSESKDNFEIVTAATGEEAVKYVEESIKKNKPFAMGFFDVLLGKGIDGIETVKKIHQLDSDMYTVLVTAYQDRDINSIQKVFGNEFQDRWDYINKPFTEGEILQKARNMVSMWNIRRSENYQRQRLSEVTKQIHNNEKMQMVAAVSRNVGHEFGNILLQIMGRADLAKDSAEVEMKKALETILLATEHASHVLQKFKNLVKPSETTGARIPIHISQPIEETLTLMEHELKKRHILISLAINENPAIIANHSLLVQVFMNLVINSCHAIGQNGTIEFTTEVKNGFLLVCVHDSGPGISNENLEKIFQPFFTTKGEKGTGLGLSICKEIIEISHGGEMKVENHPKGGALFTLSLPIKGEEDL